MFLSSRMSWKPSLISSRVYVLVTKPSRSSCPCVYSSSSCGMSLRMLADPNSDPMICFSNNVRNEPGIAIDCSVTEWMLVTTMRPRLPARWNASPSTSPLPTPAVMMTLSKPRPYVDSPRSSIASAIDAYEWVAPSSIAFSRLNSTGSMAATTRAPASLAPWTALAPMPPTPTTATKSPGPTSAAYTDEPHPVTTPQPSRHARSRGMSLSIFTTLAWLTTVWWAKVPSRHIRPRSWPSWVWCRAVPSLICLPVANDSPAMSQRFEWPEAHVGHWPQAGMKPNTTWSPGSRPVTLGPTSRTMPAPSCPPISGGSGEAPARSPVTRCSSEWHMPDAFISTSSSPDCGASSSMSSMVQSWPTPLSTAALVCMPRTLRQLCVASGIGHTWRHTGAMAGAAADPFDGHLPDRGDPEAVVAAVREMSDADLHNLAEVVRQVQIERAITNGGHDAIIASGFETGFGRDGLGVLPWVEGSVIVCPGGMVAKSKTSHRCRFVSVDDVWVWDSGLLLREDKRSSPGTDEGFRAIALVPLVDGTELDVVSGKARSGQHSVDHVVSYEVRGGDLVEVSQRNVTPANMR